MLEFAVLLLMNFIFGKLAGLSDHELFVVSIFIVIVYPLIKFHVLKILKDNDRK